MILNASCLVRCRNWSWISVPTLLHLPARRSDFGDSGEHGDFGDSSYHFYHDRSAAYRNFSVVSAKSANTSEPIQKRTMILDSDHPSSSK